MNRRPNTIGFLRVQRLLSAALVLMMVGTITELFLLHHYEGYLQLIPILCIAISLFVMLILAIKPHSMLMKLFQILMGLSALSGVYGCFLHLKANYEFEQEMKPTADSWDLFIESLSGALPALAPASMIVFALIGFTYLTLLKQKHEQPY